MKYISFSLKHDTELTIEIFIIILQKSVPYYTETKCIHP